MYLILQIWPKLAKFAKITVITADCSDNKWIVFTDAWCRYKEMSGLVDPDAIRHELRATCDPAVNEMLFNFVGPDVLNVASEEQLLAHIKSVAVKTVHREVYRQQFFSMRQSENESITRFISRLNSQAMLCDFAKQCDCGANTCTTSYSEDVIMSQTITGLYSSSHQTKILSDMNNIKTLRDLTARLLTLESTSHATDHFNPDIPNTGGITAPIRSDYKRSKDSSRPPPRPVKTNMSSRKLSVDKCKGCGRDRHVGGREKCPAQGKKCNLCSRLNHFAAVCMGSGTSSARVDCEIMDEATEESGDVSFLTSVTRKPQ